MTLPIEAPPWPDFYRHRQFIIPRAMIGRQKKGQKPSCWRPTVWGTGGMGLSVCGISIWSHRLLQIDGNARHATSFGAITAGMGALRRKRASGLFSFRDGFRLRAERDRRRKGFFLSRKETAPAESRPLPPPPIRRLPQLSPAGTRPPSEPPVRKKAILSFNSSLTWASPSAPWARRSAARDTSPIWLPTR